MLNQCETADLSIRHADPLFEDRHSRAKDVLPSPVGQRPSGRIADRREQVLPGRVVIGVRDEEAMKSRAKRAVADEVVELFENAGRFVVDDRAVVALRLVEIGKLLPHRRGAECLVDVVGCGLVAEVEGHPRIGQPFEVLHLRRHVRREAFLQPQVVEPAHRHVVAEPVVRDLMIDRRAPAETLIERRRLAIDE